MNKRIVNAKDTNGKNQLAVSIETLEIFDNLSEMIELVGTESFRLLTESVGDDYRITVVDSDEYASLTVRMGVTRFVEAVERVFAYEVEDLSVVGLGRADFVGGCEYRVVFESDGLSSVRTMLGLPPKSFFVTVGGDVRVPDSVETRILKGGSESDI